MRASPTGEGTVDFDTDGDPEGVRLIDRMNWTGLDKVPRTQQALTMLPFAGRQDRETVRTPAKGPP
ncbi:MAG: hypothetical protein EBY17_26535 [Acidobacteriia bacterium]|nr:hypothetical protein [Terriglobia bacterium]